MAYCTSADVVLLTGTTLDASTVITPMIAQADEEIDAFLSQWGTTGTTGSGALKTASIYLTACRVADRERRTYAHPNSLGLGKDLSLSDNVDATIKAWRQVADDAIRSYVRVTGSTYRMDRVNT